MSSIQLSGADLQGIYLHGADLSSAQLRDANLIGADLRGIQLNAADLRGANLRGTDLIEANLIAADLGNADLSGARLSDVLLSGANLRGTIMWDTIIANIDLREIKGLAEIRHKGPSPVALYSVQLPQNGTALHFLRGAGVPDEWIDDYRIRMMYPIQYYSCFIAYSSRDEEMARRLHADLQDHGVRCWFAPENLKIGDHYHQRIDESIHLYDKLVLILSEHAVQSAWVEREVVSAREKEDREQHVVLFPVRLDNAVMHTTKAWATDIRRRWHIGDFRKWQEHDHYQRAFERLLRDLRAER